MFASLCILGRQPGLGLAELESLYGSSHVKPVGNAALLDVSPAEVSFAFLGGTVKFCKVLTELDTTNWKDIQNFLTKSVPEQAKNLPVGKIKVGLSVYGLNISAARIAATGLEVKKALKNTGRSSRIVPNNEPALSSAQVLHNKLTNTLGWELIFVKNGNKTIVGQTIAVQDIESYAKRDQARPMRDSKVGMPPPKLAQIINNMAAGQALTPGCGPTMPTGKILLDPFCGTGVILQEAYLMGYQIYGTDLDERMVEYSQTNLSWLQPNHQNQWKLQVADATEYIWDNFDIIASETYLGRPFSAEPKPEVLNEVMRDVNTILYKFLKNVERQTQSGFRMCLAIPAWKTANGFIHLPLLDNLKELGYNRVSFVHAGDEDLIYHRPGQFVGRELVTLIRK